MGAAGIMSGAILILSEITPVAERAAYMGMIGGMWGIARYFLFLQKSGFSTFGSTFSS